MSRTQDLASAPIGIFDSGLGGLDVAAAISRRLPHERLLYWGDNARVPYGTKSTPLIQRYTYESSSQLVARGAKAIVIACNTASAAVDLEALSQELKVPVYGMIEAGVSACDEISSRISSSNVHILVLATPSTIRSRAYQNALQARFVESTVYEMSCPLFVPLVEMGWSEHPLIDVMLTAQLTDQRFSLIQKLRERRGASLIVLLGCTHYPLLALPIEYNLINLVGPPVSCIDGAQQVAELLATDLERSGVLNTESHDLPQHEAFFTDDLQGSVMLERAYDLWRQRGGVGELNFPVRQRSESWRWD